MMSTIPHHQQRVTTQNSHIIFGTNLVQQSLFRALSAHMHNITMLAISFPFDFTGGVLFFASKIKTKKFTVFSENYRRCYYDQVLWSICSNNMFRYLYIWYLRSVLSYFNKSSLPCAHMVLMMMVVVVKLKDVDDDFDWIWDEISRRTRR